MPGCGGVGGELVECGDLRRGEGAAARVGRDAAFLFLWGQGSRDAEVWGGLGSIVETEDGFDQAFERLRDVDLALAHAVGVRAVLLLPEGDAEGLFELHARAGELQGSRFQLRGGGLDGETELFREALDGLDRGGIRAELRAELGAAYAGLPELRGVDRLPATHQNGDGKRTAGALDGGCAGKEVGRRQGAAGAAGENNARDRGWRWWGGAAGGSGGFAGTCLGRHGGGGLSCGVAERCGSNLGGDGERLAGAGVDWTRGG